MVTNRREAVAALADGMTFRRVLLIIVALASSAVWLLCVGFQFLNWTFGPPPGPILARDQRAYQSGREIYLNGIR